MRRKERFSQQTGEVKHMSEEMFQIIFEGSDGNYAVQAQILAAMKPEGW